MFAIVIVLLSLVSPGFVGGQTPDLNADASIRLQATPVKFKRGVSDEVEAHQSNSTIDRLNELQRELQNLDSSVDGRINLGTSSNSAGSSGSDFGTGTGLQTQTHPWDELESTTRVSAIQDRIHLIKDLMERQKIAAEIARQPAQPAAADPTAPAVNHVPPVQSLVIELNVPFREDVSPPVQQEPVSLPPEPETKPPTDAIQVISNPVNSFELANSLFATHNYEQALKSYKALLAGETQPGEDEWLRCFSASCYRITGDIAQAESLYRAVAASKQNSYPADYSRWFLDHLSTRKRINSELDIINAELKSNVSPGESE